MLHHEIRNDQVRSRFLCLLQPLIDAERSVHNVSVLFEEHLLSLKEIRVVVDNQ